MPRAMWSGSISFGLVNVPVKLYPAVREKTVQFHMLSKDGTCRLRRKLYCPDTNEEYDYRNTTRGYEVAPDQYVIVTDEELDAIRPAPGKGGNVIEITDFVNLADIDPLFYDRPYYLAPDRNGAKAYQLLHKAMSDTQKIGIAKFVMRRKEYLAAIRPLKDALCIETMHFADEVADVSELPGVGDESEVKLSKKELEVAEKLIDALGTKFEPSKYHEEYREKVMELIERKAAGEEVVTHVPAEEEAPRVLNLMKALEESLREAKKTGTPQKRQRRKSA